MENWEKKFQEVLKSHLAEQNDPSHDFHHVMRVVNLCKHITLHEKACEHVTLPAAYFHDYVDIKKNSKNRNQASKVSSLSALNILSRMNYPHEYWDQISHAIEAHSYSANIAPKTLEAQVVQDADRLDAIGAVGIARCFSVGQYMKAKFYDPTDPFAEQRPFDDKQYTLDHFFTKLLELPEKMHTKTAKRLAQKRIHFMHDFIKNMHEEVFDFDTSLIERSEISTQRFEI